VPGTEGTPSDPAKLVEQTDAAIESTRSTVRNAAERLARGVDRWFGDKPFEQGGSVTISQSGQPDYLDPALAWVGVKDSGRGCTLSRVGYEYLTRPKSFHLRTRT